MLKKEFEECFENNEYRQKMLEHLIPSSIGEIHHIVPRSYFKLKGLKIIDENNTMKISYENHIWVHYYAWKCAKPFIRKSMVHAINMVLNNYKGLPIEEIVKEQATIREELAKNAKKQKTNKRVICLETKIEYPSLGEAERQTGVDKRLISNACLGKRLSAGGFHWCYSVNYREDLLEELLNNPYANSFKKKEIICLEKNKRFESAKEAERQTGINSKNISDCALGNIKTAGGYHWCFYYDGINIDKELEKIDNIIITRQGKKYKRKFYHCLQNDKNYKSVSEASKDLGISQPFLSRQIKKGKSAKGFTFEIISS